MIQVNISTNSELVLSQVISWLNADYDSLDFSEGSLETRRSETVRPSS